MIVSDPARALLNFDADAFARRLITAGELSEMDWRLAQEVARQNAHSPLRALLDLGLISEDALADQVGGETGLPRWRADDEEDAQLSTALPVSFMQSNNVLAFDLPGAGAEGNDAETGESAPVSLQLICADPSDHHLWSGLLGQLDAPFTIAIGAQKDIAKRLADHAERPADGADDSGNDIDISAEISQLRDMASEAPVIRFFNQAVERAMELGASDIHLERFDHRVGLRMRVDGLLVEQPAPQPRMYEPLLCRIKIMASLDIAERRLAQDGRIRMRLRGRMVDMRVSLVPTMYGQDAAIRIQDRQKLGEITLPDLGFSAQQVDQIVSAASKSHGIVLVTGPTGSGKTTTLYALLRRLVSAERKVVTVEDPVEYAMDGVNQIQANPAIGLTFSTSLRHILRHDPDVILIGEIRDQETADMAFQAALTGHMVLSTLHTNDVPGTFVRLIDMGVEPYLVNAAVEGVSAQRLVRKLCTACSNDPEQREACKACGGIGYRGRVALMEFSRVSADLKRAIVDGAEESRLRAILNSAGHKDLRESGQRLIESGMTDQTEIARVLGAHGDEIDLDSTQPAAPEGSG